MDADILDDLCDECRVAQKLWEELPVPPVHASLEESVRHNQACPKLCDECSDLVEIVGARVRMKELCAELVPIFIRLLVDGGNTEADRREDRQQKAAEASRHKYESNHFWDSAFLTALKKLGPEESALAADKAVVLRRERSASERSNLDVN